ncbi:MAG: hypothetical protein IKI22_03470 [Neisseriaceae bacterium]|nr:hypothetical protein [Neisseriaceae bacterium]
MSKKELQVCIIAIALSLLVHILIPILGLSPRTRSFEKQNNLTVTMQSFSLNDNANSLPESPKPIEKPVEKQLEKPVEKTIEKPKKSIPADSKPIPQVVEEEKKQENTQSQELDMEDGSPNDVNQEALEILKNQDEKQNQYAQEISDTPQTIPDEKPIVAKKDSDVIAPNQESRPLFPHDAKLRYEGPYSITGDMEFHRDKDSYRIDATFNVPFNKMKFHSEGKIQGNRLIPLLYTDTRKNKIYASAEFDYEKGEIIYGKGERNQIHKLDGVEAHDFFSWAWQTAIDGKIGRELYLTSGKKIYRQDKVEDVELEEILYDTGEGKLRIVTQYIDRKNKDESLKDTINYGFAKDFAQIPALIMMNIDGKDYEMHVIGINLDGHNYWQAKRQVRRNNER